MSEIRLAEKVLGYWYLMELLKQDSLPIPGASMNEKLSCDVIDYVSLNDLLATVRKHKTEAHKPYIGQLTFYFGRTKRELCIKKIAQLLGMPLKKPERNVDDIAWFSLQLAADGSYVDGSFSLSPVLWAINRLQEGTENDEGPLLTVEDYRDTSKKLEVDLKNTDGGILFKKVNDYLPNPLEKAEMEQEHAEELCMTEKSAALSKFEEHFFNAYVLPNLQNEKNVSKCLLTYHLTKKKPQDSKYAQDDYHGLCMRKFFLDDLDMVRQALEEHPEQFETGMGAALLSYITSVEHEYDQHENRINLVPSKRNRMEPSKVQAFLSSLLDIRCAPLGKWPSKFQPALMQQIAINLFTHQEDDDAVFGKNSAIFSVNGPPGTGKTTLLKEIIVHNIVERAHLLASYETPDDAFEQKYLGHVKNHSYSGYCPYYFHLKNQAVSRYGILVVSSNNAAVENISKELPKESKLREGLPRLGDGDDGEVFHCFDCSNAPKESLLLPREEREARREKRGKFPDIYFSEYATRLLSSEHQKVPAWGLISASLGKYANITAFGEHVLVPLYYDFLKKDAPHEDRLPKYRERRKKFLAQWNHVEQMREELENYTERVKQAIDDLMAERKAVSALEQELKGMSVPTSNVVDGLTKSEEELLKNAPKEMLRLREQFDTLRSSYKMSGLLFFRKKRNCTYNDEIDRQIADVKNDVRKLKAKTVKLQKKKEQLEEAQRKSEQQQQQDFDEKKHELKRRQQKLEEQQAGFTTEISQNKIALIDDTFLARFLSEDDEESTNAQLMDPGFSKEYDRAREKLFYDALQLHKEFVLSSNCCAWNIRNLLTIWGLLKKNSKERVIFNPENNKIAMADFLQTLWLFVPVISSTFASVGNFLRDVQSPGALGTLIVDEAGQALPQMAVGALYRFQKAIVVGDPKQVEPVVTEELDLLKNAIRDPELLPYKVASNSVQRFADQLNPFGTYLYNSEDDKDEWIGCPLLVHRRCIKPMYEISNKISYNGIMKLCTEAPKDKTFACASSGWLQVDGTEVGHSNHFVEAQAIAVEDILARAFELAQDKPSLYIISPFKTVTSGIRNWLQKHARTEIRQRKAFKSWCRTNIGTVHSFQGKEAEEVLFVLGCDASDASNGAVEWVDSNIVNVAATRAQYRLVVIGDRAVWQKNVFVQQMMDILDGVTNIATSSQ